MPRSLKVETDKSQVMKSGTRVSNDLNHLPIFYDRLVLKNRERTRSFQQVSNLPEVFGCQIPAPLTRPHVCLRRSMPSRHFRNPGRFWFSDKPRMSNFVHETCLNARQQEFLKHRMVQSRLTLASRGVCPQQRTSPNSPSVLVGESIECQ